MKDPKPHRPPTAEKEDTSRSDAHERVRERRETSLAPDATGSPPIRRQEKTEHPGREETQGWGAPGRSRRSSMWGRTEEGGKGGEEGEEEKGRGGDATRSAEGGEEGEE